MGDSDSKKWFIISWEIGWLIIGNLEGAAYGRYHTLRWLLGLGASFLATSLCDPETVVGSLSTTCPSQEEASGCRWWSQRPANKVK